MRIPISVINYNGSNDTIEMIKTLFQAKENFDCVIVDNNSPKENELKTIISFVEESYSVVAQTESYMEDAISSCSYAEVGADRITFIQAKENYGFAKGTNIGIKYSLYKYPDAKFIAILNNDTEVTAGFISKITERMIKYNLAAAMGTILYYGYDKPYIWSIGGKISFLSAMGVHLHKGEIYLGCDKEIVERKFISGCFSVFNAEVLREIGLIDEDYFFGCEEFQYSLDIGKKYTIAWIPDSVIYHKSRIDEGNGRSHRIADLCWQNNSYMNKIVFINKNKGPIYRFFWHILFKAYINFKIRKKYCAIPEYGKEGFKRLQSFLFEHINSKSFTQQDFLSFFNSKN